MTNDEKKTKKNEDKHNLKMTKKGVLQFVEREGRMELEDCAKDESCRSPLRSLLPVSISHGMLGPLPVFPKVL